MKLNKSFKIDGYNFSLSIDAASIKKDGQSPMLKALKNAAANFVDLIDRVLEIKTGRDIRLEIKFRALKKARGMYYPGSELIKLDTALISSPDETESVFFHEMVHHLFETHYKNSWFYDLFQEAAAVYFQDCYYRDNYIFHKLISDRFSANEFAVGYFLLYKLNKMPDHPMKFFFQHDPGGKTIRCQQKIINALIDVEYAATKTLYDKLIKNIDIIMIDERPKKSGGGYGAIYRNKQMYSPFIAYLPPRSINKLNFDNIYVKVIKIPKCFSTKFVLKEPEERNYEILATLYALAVKSRPGIEYKVNNACLEYE